MAFTNRTAPEEKDNRRIQDIVKIKAPGDKLKQQQLAKQQAKIITKPDKALRRGRAALAIKEYDVAKIFLQRVIDLNKEDLLEAEDLAALADINFAFEMGLFF